MVQLMTVNLKHKDCVLKVYHKIGDAINYVRKLSKVPHSRRSVRVVCLHNSRSESTIEIDKILHYMNEMGMPNIEEMEEYYSYPIVRVDII